MCVLNNNDYYSNLSNELEIIHSPMCTDTTNCIHPYINTCTNSDCYSSLKNGFEVIRYPS
jgi:hypothetical protein